MNLDILEQQKQVEVTKKSRLKMRFIQLKLKSKESNMHFVNIICVKVLFFLDSNNYTIYIS